MRVEGQQCARVREDRALPIGAVALAKRSDEVEPTGAADGSQRRVQTGAFAPRSDNVPIIPTAQHVGHPRHAMTATGRSASETGPTTSSRRFAPSIANNPTAPRSR
jgi:hypothetical protein